MKTKMIALGLLAATGMTAFVNADKTIPTVTLKKPSMHSELYKMDDKLSSLEWIGKKVTGQHNGTILLSSGVIEVTHEAITSGSFVADMNSITVLDVQGEYNAKFVGHLKADDFFAVDKHATAKFEIVSAIPISAAKVGTNNYTIVGKLTIKGITNEIVFPAMVKIQDGKLVGVAELKVDRTKWDIKYGSSSFFEGLGDKAIDNEFTLKLNIVAKK